MKWIVRVLVALVVVVAVIGGVGMLLPSGHVVAVRMDVRAPAERVFEVVSDVARGPEWRSGLTAVEIVSAAGAPLRWRETMASGTITMVHESTDPPRRLVSRIDDPDLPFGGRWIYDLVPAADGTTLTITEEGEVYNPFFRFFSRFVFGHYQTLETYSRDLARHLDASAEPVRVEQSG